MIKTIFKEVSIMLLLCIAILLILGILFYDYIPSNKVVPSKLASYETPENIRQEIQEQITEINKTEISYEITDSDLYLYKQTNSYISGKKDPFAAASTTANGNEQNTNEVNNNTDNTNNSNGNIDQNSTGTFFNETGLK